VYLAYTNDDLMYSVIHKIVYSLYSRNPSETRADLLEEGGEENPLSSEPPIN